MLGDLEDKQEIEVPDKGSRLEVVIERLAFGGTGVARHEALGERPLHVSFAAPGDRLLVELTKLRDDACFAKIVEVLEASSVRRDPRCRHFGVCGGCQLQHVSYEEQLATKRRFVRDALDRHGLASVTDVGLEHADEWGYRSRTQLKIDNDKLGFHEFDKRAVVEIEECPIMHPALTDKLPELRAALARVPKGKRIHQIEGVAGHGEPSFAPNLPGLRKDIAEHRVAGMRYFLEPEGFFQANTLLLDRMVEHALEAAQGELAFDLYAGVGLFALPLSKRFDRVVAVEDERRATTLARVNVKLNACDNVHYFRQTTEDFLANDWQYRGRTPDFVTIDPPRVGASRAIPGLLRLRAPRLVYVPCDPNTLAEDLRTLKDGGYAIESVTIFDMFPQTYHVESIAKLRWDGGVSGA